jgi:hypothetical protein
MITDSLHERIFAGARGEECEFALFRPRAGRGFVGSAGVAAVSMSGVAGGIAISCIQRGSIDTLAAVTDENSSNL